ncbi:NAD kinase-like isoform X2 [Pomacea canaliculata]|uniref:NAD kinase-like isoform X2 n=1 Tax=Pomacea canaliculata TaxID=400727 RepID=UPI000D738EBB|nr:NAD kinase-like isoform X2 [Pomacea canaliculata]
MMSVYPIEESCETSRDSKGTQNGTVVMRSVGRGLSMPADHSDLASQLEHVMFTPDSADEVDTVKKQVTRKTQRNRKATRSLYGVSPNCKFGPKGYLLDCTSAFLKIPDPSSQKLNWLKAPLSVLVIKKPLDHSVTVAFRDLVIWLIEEKNLLVFVEASVVTDHYLTDDENFQLVQDKLMRFREGEDDLEDKVDLIICLGGDGTLLHASSLFQQSVPPVIAFNMGSLGFLTPFQFCTYKEKITNILNGQASLLLRYRLKCVVINHVQKENSHTPIPHVKNLDKNSQHITSHILVLNEVVIDRGPSSNLCHLDLYIEGRLVTTVLGDGLIISTPTGSTAYSVAAGASMIHPNVPCILITPICPHSLSFRPIVVPAGVEIKVTLTPEARGTAMVSFDGRNRQEIQHGVSLRITTASYPVPSVCARDQIEDWFDGLADCLHWNVRRPQKALSTSASLTSLDSVDLEPLQTPGETSED